MKILNITLLASLFVFTFLADVFCQLTALPDNPSENETKTVSDILKGMQEATENYNQTLQNLQVTQTITFKSTVLGKAKITKQIHFQRPDIIGRSDGMINTPRVAYLFATIVARVRATFNSGAPVSCTVRAP